MHVFVLVHDQNPDGCDHDEVVIEGAYRSFEIAAEVAHDIMKQLDAPAHFFPLKWTDELSEIDYSQSPALSGVGQFTIERHELK